MILQLRSAIFALSASVHTCPPAWRSSTDSSTHGARTQHPSKLLDGSAYASLRDRVQPSTAHLNTLACVWGLLWGIRANGAYPCRPCGWPNSATFLEQSRNPRPRVHAHNPEVVGSNPAPLPHKPSEPKGSGGFVFLGFCGLWGFRGEGDWYDSRAGNRATAGSAPSLGGELARVVVGIPHAGGGDEHVRLFFGVLLGTNRRRQDRKEWRDGRSQSTARSSVERSA
jgi:hypothetical protein